MNVEDLISRTQDALTVKRVFGEPYERDGVTVIPAAKVMGGGGGGAGEGEQGRGTGSGGGFGVAALPAGVYVIRDGTVRWRPAFDLNRVILGGQMLALAGLLVVRSVARGRSRANKALRRR